MEEAQRRCSSREFAEWVGFECIEPEGYVQVKAQIAELTAMWFNRYRGKQRARKGSDFVLSWMPRKPQTTKELRNALMQWAKATGATVRYK